MAFPFLDLPYNIKALEPQISQKTLEYHHGKHYKGYVTTLNKLIVGTKFESSTLEEVIQANVHEDNALYHNAAQAWNHVFLWNSMSPKKPKPSDVVTAAINRYFGSIEDFKEKFTTAAKELFGSGWVWVVKKSDGTFAIKALSNAGNPLTEGETPLIVCDVWEHAYYLDYENERAEYIKQFWQVFNWDFFAENMQSERQDIRGFPQAREKPSEPRPQMH